MNGAEIKAITTMMDVLDEIAVRAVTAEAALATAQARIARLENAIRPGAAPRPEGWIACRGCGMEWAPDRGPFHQPDCWVVPLLAAEAEAS